MRNSIQKKQEEEKGLVKTTPRCKQIFGICMPFSLLHCLNTSCASELENNRETPAKCERRFLQLVFFCTKRNLHAVRYVANRITSKFCAPAKTAIIHGHFCAPVSSLCFLTERSYHYEQHCVDQCLHTSRQLGEPASQSTPTIHHFNVSFRAHCLKKQGLPLTGSRSRKARPKN